MASTVDASVRRWQNKSIPASADFRGVLGLSLLVAWFYALWLALSLPALAPAVAHLPMLLRFALAKGQYMPDFAMILAGFYAFHRGRSLALGWDRAVARRLYLRILLPLLAYGVIATLLFEAANLLAGHGFVRPWAAPLMGVPFRVLVTVLIAAIGLPLLISWLWTTIIDVAMALMFLTWFYEGLAFTVGLHQQPALWPLHAIIAFTCGAATCSVVFRTAEYLLAIRGPALILGWLALLGGSILQDPALFYGGFLMIAAAAALNERTEFLPGEILILGLSSSSIGIALVAPAVLTAWAGWANPAAMPLWLALIALAVVTQILGLALFLIAEPPLRQLLRPATA